MFAFYAVLSYTILIQTRRSSTLHLIAHVEEKFVPNVLFDTVTNLYLTPYFRSISHFWLITGFVTRLTRRVPLVELELLLFPEHLSSSPVFNGVGVTPYLVLCVFFCRSLFVLLYFFFWPLCCLFFFDIRILITPLVSSKSSYRYYK
jgi:hypothetical protein